MVTILKVFSISLIFLWFTVLISLLFCRSALAEAELEYNTTHQSKSVTVKLELCPSTLPPELNILNSDPIYALIWTTTPWTLPGNIAVVYSPILSYAFVKIHDTPGTYLLATDLVQNLSAKIGKSIDIIIEINGMYFIELNWLNGFHIT